jgi:O-antigen/teichoic acid export membrane protein
MDPIKRLAGQTVIYGLSSIVGRFLNWLLVPVYTNIFLPAEYGVVTELYAYVTFLMIVMTYGMETGFFRFAESEKDLNRVYSTSLASLFASSTIFILLFWIFSNPVAGLLRYSGHPEYITWLALIVGLDAFTAIPFAKLRQQNRPVRFMVLKFVNIFTNIAANLFFLLLCPWLVKNHHFSFIHYIYSSEVGVGYIFISNLISSLVILLFLIPDIFRNSEFRLVDRSLLRKMLGYSFPLLIVGFAGMINETSDRILLKYFSPVTVNAMEQIGIYGANYKLAILLTMFIQAFRYAAEPFFFSHAKEKNSKQIYSDVMKYFIICGLFIFLGVMLYIDIVKYFIGKNYHQGLKVVPVLLFANLFLGIIYNLSIWYKLNNMTRYGAYITIFGAVVTIILNIILIPVIGYVGSAWATFICYFLMMIVSWYYGNKYFPVKYDLKVIGTYLAVSLALWIISLFVRTKIIGVNLVINSILLMGYILFVMKREKPAELLSKNRNISPAA